MHRNSKLLAMFLMMLSMLTLAILPTSTMPWSQANVCEPYGPRLDNIHYVFEGFSGSSFAALDAGQVDIIDSPLSPTWYNTWINPARTDVKVMGYGGEYSYYILDCRQNNTKPVLWPWSTQSYCLFGDPTIVTIDLTAFGEGVFETTRGAAARHALAHIVNRTSIVQTIMGGLSDPIYTPMPAALGPLVNPNVEKHPTNIALANTILDQAGIVDGPDLGTDREIPAGQPGAGTDIVLDFLIPTGYPTVSIGTAIAGDIAALLDISVNSQFGTNDDVLIFAMQLQTMDLCIGHWTGIQFPRVDHLAWLYGSRGYSGNVPKNYMRYCGYRDIDGDGQIDFDPQVEDLMTLLLECQDMDEVRDAAWAVQERMMRKENVYTIPLVSTAAPKAWRTYKVGTSEVPGNEWKGIVNETGFGANSWWTFLSAHTDNEPDSGTITYGLSHTQVDWLNPIYASLPQSWEILGKIYDSLLVPDPITIDLIPSVAQDFFNVTEYDPIQGQQVSVVYFTLRRDVYWQDGERLTADDVIFTMSYLPSALEARGDPPPRWESNIANIHRIDKIDDFHIKVYMKSRSYFAHFWVGGNIIMPQHVWQPMVDDPLTEIDIFCPDPTLMGSGPYKMDCSDYVQGISADLYASKGGSTIPPWFRLVSPISNFVVSGEVAATAVSLPPPPPPLLLPSEIYWVGQSYAGDVCVTATLANVALAMTISVTVTLFEGPVPIGTQVITMPPSSLMGLRFPRPIAGGIGATIGPLAYQLDGTYPFPFPFIDADALTLYYKVTCDGDVISTADIPGVCDVNVYDAFTLMNNWGPTGPYTYAPADINWDGTVNIYDALIIMGNYGAAGA